jgi:hypothetical protein
MSFQCMLTSNLLFIMNLAAQRENLTFSFREVIRSNTANIIPSTVAVDISDIM